MDILVIGHLSRDLLVTPTITRETLGGGTAYAMIAPRIGAQNAAIVSKVGADFEPNYLNHLKESGLNLDGLIIEGPVSTRFVNTYGSQGNRIQHVESLAPAIQLDDLPESAFDAKIIHFSPLSNAEIDLRIFDRIKNDTNLVSLDVQGFLREVRNSTVYPRSWHEFPDIIKHVDVIKFDEIEISNAFPEMNEDEAVMRLLNMGVNIVLVTRAHHGSTVYSMNKRVDIPAIPPLRLVDNTGCGDVYSVAFLLEYRKTTDLRRAGTFAATCASFNLETVGPYNPPDMEDVLARITKFL